MNVLRDTLAMAQTVRQKLKALREQRGKLGVVVYCARSIPWLPQRVGRLVREATFDRKMGVQTSRPVGKRENGKTGTA